MALFIRLVHHVDHQPLGRWRPAKVMTASRSTRYARRQLERICEEQNHRCAYCGVRFDDQPGQSTSATRDHVIPRSKGGRQDWHNIVAACDRCNKSRRDNDAFAYFTARSQQIAGERRAKARQCRMTSRSDPAEPDGPR